jgi:hypothetical protein
LQMMYVPKPKGAKDEEMPKSMNGAVRELREAETKANQQNQHHAWEGYLSQQGGDCPVSAHLVVRAPRPLAKQRTVLAETLLQASRHKIDRLS